MRIFLSLLLVVSSAFAYQVTYPSGSQGWNTSGPNYLEWERVDTDPLNFTAVLTNMNTTNEQVLVSFVDGTVGSVLCPAPSGGWPTGSNYRVNLAQDPSHLDTLLAQSSEFSITAVSSSNQSTTSPASTQTSTSSVTTTTTTPSLSSSDTSTTPTGTSAAPLGADVRVGLVTTLGVLTALVATFF